MLSHLRMKGPRLFLPAVALLLSSLCTKAEADSVDPPADAPAAIQVPAGNVPFLVVHAIGTQNYTCTPAGTWSAAVPQADLFAANGHPLGTHFVGPTWQLKDGSSVLGAKRAGVSVTANDIDWLLVQAVSTSMGVDGDRLAKTTWIQRVRTIGGKAPAGPCTSGETVSVPYEADYYFYRAAGAE
jgi:hypothetical protein